MEKRSGKLKLYFYLGILAALSPFFFWGGPSAHASRVVKEFWNLGHVFFFMLLVRILAGSDVPRKIFGFWSVKMLAIVLTCGIMVEFVQAGLEDRISDVEDVWLDLAGGVIGLGWVGWKGFSRKGKALVFPVMLFVAVSSVRPLYAALDDELRAGRDFPLLSGFETARELSRWYARTEISRVTSPVRKGRYALRLPLTTDTYSGISMVHFPGDWRGMKGLSLSIYNPGRSDLRITILVYDRKHWDGEQHYRDRLNRLCVVQPGWNDVFISMDEIRNAPADREMNLGRISGLGLFVTRQKERKIIYLDDVRLVEGG